MNKAVLIMPYYGKLPKYLGCYLKSLEGKNIDVLWVSDLEVGAHPENFKILKLSFQAVRQLFEKILATKVVINGSRRFCDLRPMYGKVFAEYIKGYEYWGHGDCDLIYGWKFNDFMARTVETGVYDVISMHKHYLSGPTCLYRNNELGCNLFVHAANWREVCAFDGIGGVLIFDECGGEFHNKLSTGKMTLEECAIHMDNMSSVVWRTPTLKVYHEDEITESSLANGEVVQMDNGILTIDGHEISVFHYIRAKSKRWFRLYPIPYSNVRDFKIDDTGFYHSVFAWKTRCFRRPFRKLVAAFEAVQKHGLGHIVKRLSN